MNDDDTIRALAKELTFAELRLDAVEGLCRRAETEGFDVTWLIRNLREITAKQTTRG